MILGAPAGTLCLVSPSGWTNQELFVQVLKYFIKHFFSSVDNPSLLIMDNHESYLSIEALDLTKVDGVTILTFYTAGKLQQLDDGIYGPSKSYYKSAVDSWHLWDPDQRLTMYNVAECVGNR